MMTSYSVSAPPVSPTIAVRSRAAARWAGRWAWAPAALLVSLIGTQLGVLAVVLDDPTFSTEPDYYRKAVDWDARMAQARDSRALGWSTSARILAAAPASAHQLALSLSGPHGEPLTGASVHALAFFNARAARPLELELKEASPGDYRADFAASHPGLWEVRVEAARGRERYQTTLRLEIETTR